MYMHPWDSKMVMTVIFQKYIPAKVATGFLYIVMVNLDISVQMGANLLSMYDHALEFSPES